MSTTVLSYICDALALSLIFYVPGFISLCMRCWRCNKARPRKACRATFFNVGKSMTGSLWMEVSLEWWCKGDVNTPTAPEIELRTWCTTWSIGELFFEKFQKNKTWNAMEQKCKLGVFNNKERKKYKIC